MEERARLARELHDSMTQSLYSLTLLAKGWQRPICNGKVDDLVETLLDLEIAGDGRGFDIRAQPNYHGAIGLASMREHAERLGGSLEVRSALAKAPQYWCGYIHMEVSNE